MSEKPMQERLDEFISTQGSLGEYVGTEVGKDETVFWFTGGRVVVDSQDNMHYLRGE